jgi:hypothetical protein
VGAVGTGSLRSSAVPTEGDDEEAIGDELPEDLDARGFVGP